MQKDTQDFLLYGLRVRVLSDCRELLVRLRRDFSHYRQEFSGESVFMTLTAQLGPVEYARELPRVAPIWNSHQVIVYEQDGIRYCDYHHQALSIYDFDKERAHIRSDDLETLHEITYLMILSRIGKKLDLEGLHRLHACGFSLADKVILLSMDMGGGKSTLFVDVARKFSDVKILSDDSVLIDSNGGAHAFATRIGLPSNYHEFYKDKTYRLMRRKFGEKVLLPVECLEREILEEGQTQAVELLFGSRKDATVPRMWQITKIEGFVRLIGPMVIGIGLAMIVEYFWESGPKDFWVKTKIALARVRSAWNLSRRANCWRIELGTDRGANSLYIREKFGR